MKLSKSFHKFIGQNVKVTETHRTYKENINVTDYEVDDNDSTMNAIKKEASSSGLNFRVWLPNTSGTMDFRLDRVNIYIEKIEDKFQVTRVELG